MAISTESRKEFFDTIKPVKERIEASLKKEKDMLAAMRTSTAGKEYTKISLCEEMIYVATLQIQINNISLEMLETKNNDYLNDARKSIYKAIIYLEEIVTGTVDCPFSELEDKLATISNTSVSKRLDLIKKLGLAITLLVDAFGDNSKWKESFVEIRGRHAVVAKNFIDWKEAVKAYFDPHAKEYEETVLYVRLVRKLIEKSANEYRDRYETATRRIDDMRMAINLLVALRRIAMNLSDKDVSEEIRKKAVVWKNKMDADTKSGASK